MMMKILAEHLHMVLIRSVCIHASETMEHGVQRLLWEWSKKVVRDSFIANEDSFQRFAVHDRAGFFNHCPLFWKLGNALQILSFYLWFDIHPQWSCDLGQLLLEVWYNLKWRKNKHSQTHWYFIKLKKLKKITTVKEFGYPISISKDFDDCASPFTAFFLLRRYIKHCASYFYLPFQCLVIPMNHCRSCLIYYIKTYAVVFWIFWATWSILTSLSLPLTFVIDATVNTTVTSSVTVNLSLTLPWLVSLSLLLYNHWTF